MLRNKYSYKTIKMLTQLGLQVFGKLMNNCTTCINTVNITIMQNRYVSTAFTSMQAIL